MGDSGSRVLVKANVTGSKWTGRLEAAEQLRYQSAHGSFDLCQFWCVHVKSGITDSSSERLSGCTSEKCVCTSRSQADDLVLMHIARLVRSKTVSLPRRPRWISHWSLGSCQICIVKQPQKYRCGFKNKSARPIRLLTICQSNARCLV